MMNLLPVLPFFTHSHIHTSKKKKKKLYSELHPLRLVYLRLSFLKPMSHRMKVTLSVIKMSALSLTVWETLIAAEAGLFVCAKQRRLFGTAREGVRALD